MFPPASVHAPLPPLLVDSHCHLNFKDFQEDIEQVIGRARAAGVRVMQTICTDMEEFPQVLAIAEAHEGIFCSVGVHPNDSAAAPPVQPQELIAASAHPKVIGLGETGLDYYYEHSDRAAQVASFRAHIQAGRETGLPLIIHSRNADEDTVGILTEEYQQGGVRGVIHCFSSTRYLAEKSLDIGFYISISGIATFKNAVEIREIIKDIPLDRLLIETDAPYLAPVPHRGKRNEPSFVQHINKLIADIKAISEEEAASATTENFFRLFNKAAVARGEGSACA